jgi:hypothetical protein
MNDRIQSQAPRLPPSSGQDGREAIDLRKPHNGVPAWVWVLIAFGLDVAGGLRGAGVFFLIWAEASPPQVPVATVRAVEMPLPAPSPAGDK